MLQKYVFLSVVVVFISYNFVNDSSSPLLFSHLTLSLSLFSFHNYSQSSVALLVLEWVSKDTSKAPTPITTTTASPFLQMIQQSRYANDVWDDD
mmetsp:Transcript_14911/g.16759  ORF Transcript_14911/g.16759 Transcript_14911/m.16759 type:complete len:94 (+) Transcript_14911:61-342(+)